MGLAPQGCRLSPAFSTPGTSNQFSVVGSQLSAGNLRFANGTKIAAVWDGLCSAGSTGLSPALQRRDASPCGQYFRAKTTRRKGSRDWSHRLTLLRHWQQTTDNCFQVHSNLARHSGEQCRIGFQPVSGQKYSMPTPFLRIVYKAARPRS